MRQAGFWDYEEHLARLTRGGDPLVKLAGVVDFEPFRYRLEKALKRSDGAKGGRPPYDPVLMFKVLVLQALYNLSDDQAEFQIRRPAFVHAVFGAEPGCGKSRRQDDLAVPRAAGRGESDRQALRAV
jgi:hypothetical protein